jgi:phosphoribosylanthranilate isomerase
VFVNATLDEVASTADRCGLTLVQLHGDEGPAYCREAARRTGCKVMKAVRVRDAAQVRDLQRFHTDFHLLDAYSPRTPGGTGETFAWELAREHGGEPPVVLSGGLTPENVGDAIGAARPFAVDTASGTEAEPGRKDPAKLKAFFRAVEAADRVAV